MAESAADEEPYGDRLLPNDSGVQLCDATLTSQQMAIVALNDPDGVWELDAAVAEEVFNLMDRNGNGELTLDEIRAAVEEDDEVQVFLTNCNQPLLRGLLDQTLLEDAFYNLDKDKSQTVSRAEWQGLIETVGRKRLAYLEAKAHLMGQCYWGRGSRLSEDSAFLNPCGLVTKKWLRRGWLDDFWFYTQNNHPLIALCMVDKDHPLSRPERAALEFVTQGFSFMMSGMHDFSPHDGSDDSGAWKFFWDPNVYGIVFVTIPGMILFKILVVMYTCPLKMCWVDETAATALEVKKMRRCHKIGHYMSFLFIAAAIGFYGLGLYMYFFADDPVQKKRLEIWFQGRVQGYVLWFVTTFLWQFNPWIKCECALVSLGIWDVERDRVHRLLVEWEELPDHDACDKEVADSMPIRAVTAGGWSSQLSEGERSPFEEDILAAKMKTLSTDYTGFVFDGTFADGGTVYFKKTENLLSCALPCERKIVFAPKAKPRPSATGQSPRKQQLQQERRQDAEV